MDITVNSRKGIQLNGKWIECEVKRKSDLIARVVLESNFTIPPSSEVILYGCGQNQELLDTRYSMIQPVIEDSRKFMVAQTLVDPFMKNIPVRLINLDSEPIRLKKNYLLGELHPVDYIENMFELENDRVDTLTSKQSKMCKTHELSKENFTLSETIEKANIPEKWESEIKICKINELNGKQKKKAENQLLPEHLKDLYERSSKDIESESIKEKLAEVLQKNRMAFASSKTDLGTCLKHQNADALSRQEHDVPVCNHSTNSSEDTCKACEQINEQWKSFKTEVDDVKELNYKVTVRAVVTRSQEQPDWLAKYSVKEMQAFQKEDQDLKYLHQWKKEGKIPERELCASLSPATRRYWLNWENIELIDGIVYQKWINAKSKLNHLQLIVPQILKKDILVLSHNTPYSGHMGVKKTIEKMKTVFTWYKMSQDITEHIQNCTICNKIKGTGKKPKAPLMDYRTFVNKNVTNRDEYINLLLAAYRSTPHPATGFSPNYMMLGREVNIPLNLMFRSHENRTENNEDYISTIKSHFQNVYEIARENLKTNAERQKRDHDTRLTDNRYELGALVYKFDKTVNKKFRSPWLGPFVITKILSPVVYEIRGEFRTEVVHHDRLKPCNENMPIWAKASYQ
ncbi:unnamed protein product [Mytilus edulis]|uniref:Integrase zinc-binding domain-containing protein n=1 Tax=Mytilus edulis TaxID=6550 RepID=A0A8S3RQE6_MYTED|nr:unnamed protein product [Mytilus edulis]